MQVQTKTRKGSKEWSGWQVKRNEQRLKTDFCVCACVCVLFFEVPKGV